MSGLVGFCLLLVIFGCCHAIPRIISRPQVLSVNVGEAAMFKCQISSPQDGVASWSSVTYNFKILQGSQLLANDAIKYSLKSTAGGQMYNLQILNIEKSDQGFYRCAIEGTDQQIISQLIVLDKPSMLLPGASTLNVTDCCLAEGISKSCLPICYPSQVDLDDFNLITSCATVENLQGFSKCLTGGSNLDNCCLSKKVQASCLDICHNAVYGNLTKEYFNECYADANIKGIFSCFEIGFETLPSEPTSVNAVALCDKASGSILMRWSEPTKNPQKVTGFKIMYKSSNQEIYNSVLVKNPNAFEYLLNGSEIVVLADTYYMIHISAIAADDGVSAESMELDVFVPNCTFPVNQSTVAIGSTTAFTKGTNREIVIFETTTVLTRSTKEETSILDTYSTITPSGSTSRLDDILNDDRLVRVAIGVGVAMCIICLVAIIILAVFFVHKSRFQSSMAFENPSFHDSEAVKLQAAYDKHSNDKKLKEAQGVLYM